MLSLHMYDFDGTLFRSPHPPALWEDDWWVDVASLSPPVVPLKPGSKWWVSQTVSSAKQSCSNPEVYAVLVTGRPQSTGLRYRVPELLRSAGLHFDEVRMNTGGDVMAFKVSTLKGLLERFDQIESVSLWEDKKSHLARYVQTAEASGIAPSLIYSHHVIAQAMPADALEIPDPQIVVDRFKARKKMKYLALFLDSRSKAALTHMYPASHDNQEYGHVTLAFDITRESVQSLIGQRGQAQVIGYAEDDKAQVVAVSLKNGLSRMDSLQPHVTLSVASGVTPVYSNKLLAEGFNPVSSGLMLTGYVDTSQ